MYKIKSFEQATHTALARYIEDFLSENNVKLIDIKYVVRDSHYALVIYEDYHSYEQKKGETGC